MLKAALFAASSLCAAIAFAGRTGTLSVGTAVYSPTNASREARFASPPACARLLPIRHSLPKDAAAVAAELTALKDEGFGGFVGNVEMSPNYLRDAGDWQAFRGVVEKARELGMVFWLYDEKGYPSGPGGGRTLEGRPELQARAFLVSVTNEPGGARRVTGVRDAYLYEGTHIAIAKSKFRYDAYPNLLLREATDRFVEATHEAYRRALGPALGYVDSTFTDEPSLMTLWKLPMPELCLPVSGELLAAYEAKFGHPLQADVSALVTGEPVGKTAEIRHRYWTMVAERVAKNYTGRLTEWASANGILSGGHLLAEESLGAHVPLYGDFFRVLRGLSAPGCDMLTSLPETVNPIAPVLAGSAGELNGALRVMSEASEHRQRTRRPGDDRPPVPVTARQIVGALNRQIWGGVNLFTSYYRWENYTVAERRAVNEEIGRTLTLTAEGRSAAEVALLYPADALMTGFEPQHRDAGGELARRISDCFKKALHALFKRGWPLLVVDAQSLASAEVRDGALACGPLAWRTVVLPSAVTLPLAAVRKLAALQAAGGQVIVLGDRPVNSERAFPDAEVSSLAAAWTPLSLAHADRLPETIAARHRPPFEVVRGPERVLRFAHRRTAKDGDVLFVANDSPAPWTGALRLAGAPEARVWNPRSGSSHTVAGEIPLELPPYAAVVLTTAAELKGRMATAKWIGPDPRTRPEEDFGAAEWIAAPAGTNLVTTLTYAFDCAEIPADQAVEMVTAAVPEYGIAVNGKTFYKWSGHVRDARYPVYRDLRPWLRKGRNEIAVTLSGEGERAFIAKIVRPGLPVLTTGADWSSPQGAVRTLGRMRETEFGKRVVLRTETVSPAFAKTFRVKGPVRSAQLRVTGVGFYEAHLNGRKIGDKVLDPSPTAYDKRVLYSTYDLTGDLRQGENELLVLLGHGWYDNRSVATWNFETAPWRDFPRTIARLDIAYADGTCETVATDASWRQVANPVIYDDVYEGEVVDGRVVAGAALPGPPLFAAEVEGPKGHLVPEEQPGAKVMEELRASAVHPLGEDACLIEFPVNVSGWMRLRLFGQKSGDVVSFRYDERANADGTPAAESVRDGLHDAGAPGEVRHVDEHFRYPASFRFCAKDAAFQCDRYICRGEDGETYEPRFSYKGFRFVLVRGLARLPKPEDAVASFIHTGFETIGSFACSDATFNRLMESGVRAYKGNFTDGVPTDCPHREKNGWTGDASVASELAQYLFENTAGYEKWLRDLLDAQLPSGDLPGIVPTSGWGFRWGNGPAWDSALPVVAWNLWIYRGNRRILDEVYPALKRYLGFTATKADASGLVRHGLGDWVPVDRAHMPAVEFTSSCYYYQAQRIAAEMAGMKGLADDAAAFAAAAAKTRAGLRAKFAKADGVWENGGQTAQGMALAFGLVDAAERPAAERQLVASVARADGHVDMGLLGTKHVFRALSRAGRTDLAWKMLTNPTPPSPVEWLRFGGGTLCEDWKGNSSRNHIMFGDFVGWAYQYLAGLRLAEADGSTSAVTLPVGPAFRRVVVEPVLLSALDSLTASVALPGGKLGVAWVRRGKAVEVEVSVPVGTLADIRLPGRPPESVGAGVRTYRLQQP